MGRGRGRRPGGELVLFFSGFCFDFCFDLEFLFLSAREIG